MEVVYIVAGVFFVIFVICTLINGETLNNKLEGTNKQLHNIATELYGMKESVFEIQSVQDWRYKRQRRIDKSENRRKKKAKKNREMKKAITAYEKHSRVDELKIDKPQS